MIQGKVTINRSLQLLVKKYTIEVDGIAVATLKDGQKVEFTVTEGLHLITFWYFGKCEKSVQIEINENSKNLYFNARLSNISSIIELTKICDSQYPIDLVGNGKPQIEPIVVGKIILVAIPLLLVTCLLGVILFSSPETANVADNTVVQEDLTPEEQAQLKLSEATEKFDSGKYIEAHKICDEILLEYPETQCSANMQVYLNEQYSKFTHISATRLMSEYTNNVVNADETYGNQVLIVDGVVHNIDKTDGDKTLAVLLKSGEYFKWVQLNFDTDQTEAVAKLLSGDYIKVMGRCTNQSGTYFLLLEGDNVMMEDCYIIK